RAGGREPGRKREEGLFARALGDSTARGGWLQARAEVGSECELEGYEGSPRSGVVAAAHASTGRRRSREVPRVRGERSHDAQVREALSPGRRAVRPIGVLVSVAVEGAALPASGAGEGRGALLAFVVGEGCGA